MLAYHLVLVSVAVTGIFFCERKKSRTRDLVFLLAATAVMIAMAAVRADTVGVDYKPYADYFGTLGGKDLSFLLSGENLYRTEPGFSLLSYLTALFTDNVRVYMGLVPALIIGLRAACIYRYSSSVWVSVFVYISFGFFGYALCTLRQELAISVALFALKYLQERRPVPYVLIVLLAASFHNSLLVLLPVYFLVQIPLSWKSFAVYASGTVLILLFSTPILGFITRYVYQGYTEDSYFLRGRNFNTAYIPLILLVVTLLMRQTVLRRNPKNMVYLNFVCYAGLLFILTLKHFIFQRIALVFLPAAIFLIPEILNAIRVDEHMLEELSKLETGPKTKKKQTLQKRGKLKNEVRDARSIYYATIGFVLFGGFLYHLFLLYANRLLIVPYVTFFQ